MNYVYCFRDTIKSTCSNDNMIISVTDDYILVQRRDMTVEVDLSVLENWSTTSIVYNVVTEEMYTLYGYREILQATGLRPKDFHTLYKIQGMVQVDRGVNGFLIKCFLLPDSKVVVSGLSRLEYRNYIDMYEIDRDYSWNLLDFSYKIEDIYLIIEIKIDMSEFWNQTLFANYAGQSVQLYNGSNKCKFKFVNGEDVFIGKKNSRYCGRRIRIE